MINWSTIGLIVAWTLILFFVRLFECGPNIEYITSGRVYEESPQQLHCLQIKAVGVAFPLSDLVTDFIVLWIPLYWVSTYMAF